MLSLSLGLMRVRSTGPPGNPLKFFEPDSESIELSTDDIALLTTDQQTFFTGASWDTFALFYADVSAESWFNDGNAMGRLDPTEEKYNTGFAIWPEAAPQRTLNKGLIWFGYEPVVIPAMDEAGAAWLQEDGTAFYQEGV